MEEKNRKRERNIERQKKIGNEEEEGWVDKQILEISVNVNPYCLNNRVRPYRDAFKQKIYQNR